MAPQEEAPEEVAEDSADESFISVGDHFAGQPFFDDDEEEVEEEHHDKTLVVPEDTQTTEATTVAAPPPTKRRPRGTTNGNNLGCLHNFASSSLTFSSLETASRQVCTSSAKR